jgi:hypothetical protein
MNTLEDTLRAALHETGAEIIPQSVPPLRLHDGWRRPGRPTALRNVPPYYVDLVGKPWSRSAEVRATTTGAVLATVRPPKPFGLFDWVSGASDDRTFILATQRWWPIGRGGAAEKRDSTTPLKFFRLRFNPAHGTATLTAVALPESLEAAQVGGIGLSPDGSKLALSLRQSIQIVTLATGAKREWVLPGWLGREFQAIRPAVLMDG